MATWRNILTYWTETKRIVDGEVKQTVCCCKLPGRGAMVCAVAAGNKTRCRCNCHVGKTGPKPPGKEPNSAGEEG
jgi:hypothetical protein